jgi:ATP synthase protein I
VKDDLAESARRRHDRLEKQKQGGEPSFLQSLAYIGSLGWMVVVPTLLGIFAGRALDHGQGITWTSKTLPLGLALGCWLAWKRIKAA